VDDEKKLVLVSYHAGVNGLGNVVADRMVGEVVDATDGAEVGDEGAEGP
jgi:hypothetical protein